jgi:hypothetical protein
MNIRQPGCHACEESSSGDCGMHGPRYYTCPGCEAKAATIATLTAERDGWKEAARLYAGNVYFWLSENSKHLSERDALMAEAATHQRTALFQTSALAKTDRECIELRAKVADLEAATRRVVEAAQGYRECRGMLHGMELDAALSDPVLVALRRE